MGDCHVRCVSAFLKGPPRKIPLVLYRAIHVMPVSSPGVPSHDAVGGGLSPAGISIGACMVMYNVPRYCICRCIQMNGSTYA